jgi:hypothetical protein
MKVAPVMEPPISADDIRWDLGDLPAPPPSDDLLTDALMEAMAYRLLAQQALHYAHDLCCAVDRLTAERNRLLDENRALRAPAGAHR